MAILFPSLTPTSRSFIAPTYPITSTRSQNGITTRRIWANVPSDARLSLTFTNIRDADALSICNCYVEAKGSHIELILPTEVFAGADVLLTNYLKQPNVALRWHFADNSPPKVDSILPGLSSVNLELLATLDYP